MNLNRYKNEGTYKYYPIIGEANCLSVERVLDNPNDRPEDFELISVGISTGNENIFLNDIERLEALYDGQVKFLTCEEYNDVVYPDRWNLAEAIDLGDENGLEVCPSSPSQAIFNTGMPKEKLLGLEHRN
jgi:hypothetical protein